MTRLSHTVAKLILEISSVLCLKSFGGFPFPSGSKASYLAPSSSPRSSGFLLQLPSHHSTLPTSQLCISGKELLTLSSHMRLSSVLHLALDVLPPTWEILSHLPKFRFICFPFQSLPLARKQLTSDPWL